MGRGRSCRWCTGLVFQIFLLAGVSPGLVLLNDAASRYRASVMLFQRLVSSTERRRQAAALTLGKHFADCLASSPAPSPQAKCCIRSARRGSAESGMRSTIVSDLRRVVSRRLPLGSRWRNLHGCASVHCCTSFPAHCFVYRRRLAESPPWPWRSPSGHGRRRGAASAFAAVPALLRCARRLAFASAAPSVFPSADGSLLMSMAPEDGLLADPFVRRGDVRSSLSPLAGSGLMSLLWHVCCGMSRGILNWDFKDLEGLEGCFPCLVRLLMKRELKGSM